MLIGGRALELMRQGGKRPPGFIVVTECRAIASRNRKRDLYPLVFEPGKTYDWRVIHGLDVRLVTWLRRDEVAPVCMEILESGPLTFNATYYTENSVEHDHVIPYATR